MIRALTPSVSTPGIRPREAPTAKLNQDGLLRSQRSGTDEDPKTETKQRGIVRRVDPKVQPHGADLDFSADYTVTSTIDGGGKVLTDVEVISASGARSGPPTRPPRPPATTTRPPSRAYDRPLHERPGQYRGVGQGTLIFTDINDDTSPADLYTDADVVTMLQDRIAHHGMPAPSTSHNRFYAVIAPVGIRNSNTQFAGQHQSFTVNGVTGWYAWVDNKGTLTGHDASTKVFSTSWSRPAPTQCRHLQRRHPGRRDQPRRLERHRRRDRRHLQQPVRHRRHERRSVLGPGLLEQGGRRLHPAAGRLAFWTDKDTFGKDEVQDVINTQGGVFTKAFFLVLDGFSQDSFNALAVSVPTPTGTFANIPSISITREPGHRFRERANPAASSGSASASTSPSPPRRWLHSPTSGSQTFELDAFIATNGAKAGRRRRLGAVRTGRRGRSLFHQHQPDQNNVFYLSQDLRVFTATPGLNNVPVPGGPTLADSTGGAFTYVQQLLTWLNGNFSDPNGADPFSTIIPGQGGAFNGDSSVTPFTIDFTNPFDFQIFSNYNFAIARVRLRGSSAAPARPRTPRCSSASSPPRARTPTSSPRPIPASRTRRASRERRRRAPTTSPSRSSPPAISLIETDYAAAAPTSRTSRSRPATTASGPTSAAS